MKIKFTFTALLSLFFLFSINGFAASASKAKTIQSANDEKIDDMVIKAEDIRTFSFEKIFARANMYYEAARKWDRVKCVPKTAFVCTKRECPKLEVQKNSYMVLDKKNKTIALCRAEFCSYFSAKYEQSGVFILAEVEELAGVYIRVLGDSRYKEISMVGLDSYISNGECFAYPYEEDIAHPTHQTTFSKNT